MKKVVTILVTYNSKKWIEKCLISLHNSSIDSTIIVIDNASTDGTQDYIINNFPQIELIQLKLNYGFGKANNIGIQQAYKTGADYVFLINHDAWVEKDTIEQLVCASIENPLHGILSPIHLNGKGDALDYKFSHYIIPNLCIGLYSDIYLNRTEDKVYDASFVNAAAWLMTRKTIETVGGFNPSFFHYGEDDNYVHRLHYHRLKIGVLPNARIFHDRENREEKSMKNLQTQVQFTTRQWTIKLSNPYSFFTKRLLIWSFCKKTAKCLIQLRLRQMVLEILVLRNLLRAGIHNIIRNRQVSQNKGPVFLDVTFKFM